MPKLTEIGLMLHCPSSMDCWDSFLIIFFESFWQFIWILISTCFTVLLEPFLCQNAVLDADFLHQKGWQYIFQKKNATPVTGTLKARQFPGGKCLYQRDKSHSIAKFNESPIKTKVRKFPFSPSKTGIPAFFHMNLKHITWKNVRVTSPNDKVWWII